MIGYFYAKIFKDIIHLKISARKWSTIGDKKHNQRGLTIPQNVKDLVPDNMKIVYWTYYPHAPEAFDDYISQRFQLSDKVMFAGGIYGKVVRLGQEEIIGVEIAPKTIIDISRFSVQAIEK